MSLCKACSQTGAMTRCVAAYFGWRLLRAIKKSGDINPNK